MERRRLLLVRRISLLLILANVFTLSGCHSSRIYDDAVDSAERGVALYLESTADETSKLLESHAALSELSEEDIRFAFLNDLRGYTEESRSPDDKKAVFDIIENPDGTVTFFVFFGSSVFSAGGLTSTNVSRHSCGALTGRFTEPDLVVRDADCPPTIASFAGVDSRPLSMTENAAQHDVVVGGSR